MSLIRTRWAALGAAVAVTLGGGGIGLVSATSPADATAFIAITPCRVMDTRPDPAINVGPKSSPLGPDEEHAVTAVGNSGDCTAVPADAAAVSLNVTALDATQSTFLTIYASNVTRPDASSLNPEPGDPPTPNAVTTEVSPSGQFTVFNRFGNVHVIADINGYYVDHHHDDRYYTEDEVNGLLTELTGDNIADNSLRLRDLRADRGVETTQVNFDFAVPGDSCRGIGTFNYSDEQVGHLVIATIVGPSTRPYLDTGLIVMPSIVTDDTAQVGTTVVDVVVCNTSATDRSVRAGSTISYRQIEP